jgi:hypothetical protein
VEENALEKVKLARGRYRIVMMSCGYVEGNTTSWLIFSTHSGRFDTAAEATMELALDLHAKYEEDVLQYRVRFKDKCCQATAGNPEHKFCSTCGAPLHEVTFDSDEFMEYVIGLHKTTCDSYGSAEDTVNRQFAFWPWRAEDIIGAAPDEVVFIAENGELVMLNALYESREDLRKLDANFAENHDDWRLSDWEDVRRKGTNSSH